MKVVLDPFSSQSCVELFPPYNPEFSGGYNFDAGPESHCMDLSTFMYIFFH